MIGLVGHQQPRAEPPCQRPQFIGSEPREERHRGDQCFSLQAKVERWQRGAGQFGLVLAFQVVEQLAADQAFLEQVVIARQQQAQPRLLQKPDLQRLRMLGVLPAQRVKRPRGGVGTSRDDAAQMLGHGRPQQCRQPALRETRQFAERQPAGQQHFEPDRNLVLQRRVEMHHPMQEMRDPKRPRKRQQQAGGAVVAGKALGPRRFQHQIGVLQQPFDRAARHRVLLVMVEHDAALTVGQRDEADANAVLVGNRLFDLGLRGLLFDACVITPADRFGRGRARPGIPARSRSRHRARRSAIGRAPCRARPGSAATAG